MRNFPKGQPKIKDFVWVNPDKKAIFYTNWKFIVLVYNKFPIRIMPWFTNK